MLDLNKLTQKEKYELAWNKDYEISFKNHLKNPIFREYADKLMKDETFKNSIVGLEINKQYLKVMASYYFYCVDMVSNNLLRWQDIRLEDQYPMSWYELDTF